MHPSMVAAARCNICAQLRRIKQDIKAARKRRDTSAVRNLMRERQQLRSGKVQWRGAAM